MPLGASVQVRETGRPDAATLAQVHLDTVVVAYAGIFPPTAPAPTVEGLASDWEAAFEDPSFRAFLAETGGTPVGTVAVRSDPDIVGVGQLRRLHVLPEHWGEGIGSCLYRAAIGALAEQGCREAGLWVLEANARARDFYERRGWSLVAGKILTWPELGTVEVRYRLELRGSIPKRQRPQVPA